MAVLAVPRGISDADTGPEAGRAIRWRKQNSERRSVACDAVAAKVIGAVPAHPSGRWSPFVPFARMTGG